MKRRNLLQLSGAAALSGCVSALSGCAGATAHYYRLAALPGSVRGGTGQRIGVRAVGLPAALAQPGLPVPGDAYQANSFPNDLWAAPLASMLQSTMVQNLALRLPADIILLSGGTIGAQPDLYVEINILALTPDSAGNITLQAQLATRHTDAQDFAVRNFTATSPGAATPESIAAAISTLWAQAADQLAAMLA